MAVTIGNSKTKRRSQGLAFIFCICVVSLLLMGMGEKYRTQGHALSPIVYDVLINEGYCLDLQDCYRKEVMFGEDGNRVNLHLYGVHDRKVIASVLSVVATEGMVVTGGVPITIRFFSKPKKEIQGLKSFTASPSIIMEVNE